jgi:hypothetical protein
LKQAKEALTQAAGNEGVLNDARWMAKFLKGAASTIVESCGGSIDWDWAGSGSGIRHLGVGGQVGGGQPHCQRHS